MENEKLGMKNGGGGGKIKNWKFFFPFFFRFTAYNVEHIFFSSHYQYPHSLSKTFRHKI